MSAPDFAPARRALAQVPADGRRAVIEWCLQLADLDPSGGWATLAAHLEGWLVFPELYRALRDGVAEVDVPRAPTDDEP